MKCFRKEINLVLFVFFLQGIAYCQLSNAYEHNKTLTYAQTISAYHQLDSMYRKGKLLEYGQTDAGKPLHLFVISNDADFNPASLKKKGRRVVMICNGIHPGEPCGIDASVKLAEDLLSNITGKKLPEHVVICIIPIYNIGGALNRSCCSRANQNGPEEYGFRGNARNLDLNRDFIKCDSHNAKSFEEMFQLWHPDIYVDTHTSDGADYSYVMTLITTQLDKLQADLSDFVKTRMLGVLYDDMEKAGYEMIPYVDKIGTTPEEGIRDFLETPRYSTGYTTLFNTIGFITEAHMLKPFKDRVLATYFFLLSVIRFTDSNHKALEQVRKKADREVSLQKDFTLSWKMDSSRFDTLSFKGYKAKYITSNVTGLNSLWYDPATPYQKEIPYYNHLIAKDVVKAPYAYIVPASREKVIERLKLNNIEMYRLKQDTTLEVEVYYINNYHTINSPFEGHYLHTEVQTRIEKQRIRYHLGDYLIILNQASNRYIVETLEPRATDSYFAWNFFDEILQQKEWFSDYLFAKKAEKMLQDNSAVKKLFEAKKSTDKEFAANKWAMLEFLYRHSEWYEKEHMRYPVARVPEAIALPLMD